MTDLVERLRGEPREDQCWHPDYICVPGDCPCDYDDMGKAADEIERLRLKLVRYRAALNAISCQDADCKDEGVVWCAERARAALREGE